MDGDFIYDGLRQKLVTELVAKGITDKKVLEAIGQIPRHKFIDSALYRYAYKDQSVTIASGQTISQPYTVAFQTQLLDVSPRQKVLEVGTGSGYQSAVLYALGVNLFTIERQRELFVKTRKLLESMEISPRFFFGDGYAGISSYAPFDRILVTCGAESIPEKLLLQLKVGGKMVIPLGKTNAQIMTLFTKISDNTIEKSEHGLFTFVPMLNGVAR